MSDDPQRSQDDMEGLMNRLSMSHDLQCCSYASLRSILDLPKKELLAAVQDESNRHKLDRLLGLAMLDSASEAAPTIIAAWPKATLSLSEVFPDCRDYKVAWTHIYKGVLQRRKPCKMTCLDLGNIEAAELEKCSLTDDLTTQDFGKSLEMLLKLPIISLPSSWRSDVDNLVEKVFLKLKVILPDLQRAKTKSIKSQINKQFRNMVEKKLKMILRECKGIQIPHLKGAELEVRIQSLALSFASPLWETYMLVHSLRSMTQVKLRVIGLKTDWKGEAWSLCEILDQLCSETGWNDTLRDSLQTYMKANIFRCHDPESLQRLALSGTDECITEDLVLTLCGLTNLRSFELTCAVYRKRPELGRRLQQNAIHDMLSSMHLLESLQMATDCMWFRSLGEMLDAVSAPLGSLGLKNCFLSLSDLLRLACSKHAASLQELDLEGVTIEETLTFASPRWPTMKQELMEALEALPELRRLNIRHTSVAPQQMARFCNIIDNHLKKLQELKMTMTWWPDGDDPGAEKVHERVCQACGRNTSMRVLELMLDTYPLPSREFINHLESDLITLLQGMNREDIKLTVIVS